MEQTQGASMKAKQIIIAAAATAVLGAGAIFYFTRPPIEKTLIEDQVRLISMDPIRWTGFQKVGAEFPGPDGDGMCQIWAADFWIGAAPISIRYMEFRSHGKVRMVPIG
jgi:hypothetical protein